MNRSAHGLRKAAATVAAENGATEAELGWTDRRMASHYTKKANRKKLAYGGVATLERMTGSMDHRANDWGRSERSNTPIAVATTPASRSLASEAAPAMGKIILTAPRPA
jgi:hypothetical protein